MFIGWYGHSPSIELVECTRIHTNSLTTRVMRYGPRDLQTLVFGQSAYLGAYLDPPASA